MVYDDVKKYGLVGILPNKKRYGTPKDIKTVTEAIKNTPDFIYFALSEEKEGTYLNEIMEMLVEWVIKCNEVYYKYELKYNL